MELGRIVIVDTYAGLTINLIESIENLPAAIFQSRATKPKKLKLQLNVLIKEELI